MMFSFLYLPFPSTSSPPLFFFFCILCFKGLVTFPGEPTGGFVLVVFLVCNEVLSLLLWNQWKLLCFGHATAYILDGVRGINA